MLAALKRTFHRHVWRRLPRTMRRYVLFRGAALLAPRLTTNPAPGGPFIVVGTFKTASGLGESARLCHDALQAAGFQVFGIDLTDVMMQVLDFREVRFVDGRHVTGPGTLILHVNAPLMPLAMRALGRRLVRDKRVVGYWAWELPELPGDWRVGMPFVHAVWTPSRFVAAAVRPASGNLPVHVVPHPIATRTIKPVDRSEGGRFSVLAIFNMASGFARKNPDAVVHAFRRAFGADESARLTVKLSNPGAFPEGNAILRQAAAGQANIVFIDETVTTAELDRLYDETDVVVSLHRSEGFGLIVAEAMLRGIAVIATDWSGTTDFFNAKHGVPVGYRLVPALDPQDTYNHPRMLWADADIDAAARALVRLRTNRETRIAMGQAARADALAAFSPQAYARHVRRALGTR